MKHGKSVKEYLAKKKTSALLFKEKQTKCWHRLHSNFRQIHRKLEIGTKPDAECLARSGCPGRESPFYALSRKPTVLSRLILASATVLYSMISLATSVWLATSTDMSSATLRIYSIRFHQHTVAESRSESTDLNRPTRQQHPRNGSQPYRMSLIDPKWSARCQCRHVLRSSVTNKDCLE